MLQGKSIQGSVHMESVRGAMLSVCPVPGCTTLTMGGTCVRHDSPVKAVFPRGRPFTPERGDAVQPLHADSLASAPVP